MGFPSCGGGGTSSLVRIARTTRLHWWPGFVVIVLPECAYKCSASTTVLHQCTYRASGDWAVAGMKLMASGIPPDHGHHLRADALITLRVPVRWLAEHALEVADEVALV